MPKNQTREVPFEDIKIKSFVDMIAPSAIKFNVDHFICGNTFRCVYALREYPTATDHGSRGARMLACKSKENSFFLHLNSFLRENKTTEAVEQECLLVKAKKTAFFCT